VACLERRRGERVEQREWADERDQDAERDAEQEPENA
jgi:hypothetical protein